MLLGDAKATAHFSIGSGTKLAMEDAIALHARGHGTAGPCAEVLARFERGRREAVEKIQHAADVSLVWFEHVAPLLADAPDAVRVRRDDAVEGDHLRRSGAARARFRPARSTPLFARGGRRQRANRAEATMAADVPAVPAARHDADEPRRGLAHVPVHARRTGCRPTGILSIYGARATGGAGPDLHRNDLPVARTPASHPAAPDCGPTHRKPPGPRIVGFTHAHGRRRICLQLGHAGRKGGTRLMWDGMDRAAAGRRLADHLRLRHPLLPGQPDAARDGPRRHGPGGRTSSARRRDRGGERCGFDMLELHCAHGYLLGQLPVAADQHPHRRLRRHRSTTACASRLEVFDTMRAVWPAAKPMSVRLSATDWADGGISERGCRSTIARAPSRRTAAT